MLAILPPASYKPPHSAPRANLLVFASAVRDRLPKDNRNRRLWCFISNEARIPCLMAGRELKKIF